VAALGRRIRVFWPSEDRWREGTIVFYHGLKASVAEDLINLESLSSRQGGSPHRAHSASAAAAAAQASHHVQGGGRRASSGRRDNSRRGGREDGGMRETHGQAQRGCVAPYLVVYDDTDSDGDAEGDGDGDVMEWLSPEYELILWSTQPQDLRRVQELSSAHRITERMEHILLNVRAGCDRGGHDDPYHHQQHRQRPESPSAAAAAGGPSGLGKRRRRRERESQRARDRDREERDDTDEMQQEGEDYEPG